MSGLSQLEKLFVWYGTSCPNHPRKWWLHDRMRRLLGVCPDVSLEVERQGLRWVLNPADYTDAGLFWFGSREGRDMGHLQRLVRPGAVIFDLGANYGHYSLTLAATLVNACRIHALEPDPANYARLCRHIAMNCMDKVVDAHQVGVSDRSETVSMQRPLANTGHSAVAVDGVTAGVKLMALDDFIAAQSIERCDLLMIDVEGYEERALRGAEKSINRFRPLIFVELFPPVMARQGSSPTQVAAILAGHSYRMYVAGRETLEPLTVMPSGDCRVNAFCFPVEAIPDNLQR